MSAETQFFILATAPIFVGFTALALIAQRMSRAAIRIALFAVFAAIVLTANIMLSTWIPWLHWIYLGLVGAMFALVGPSIRGGVTAVAMAISVISLLVGWRPAVALIAAGL